jgi:uncharacterized membrane protein
MTPTRRSVTQVTCTLVLASAVSCVFLVGQEWLIGTRYWRFLVWNLVLAWIPFGITVALSLRDHWGRVTGAFAAGVWLLFLPNAPYLITDVMHLTRSGTRTWSEVMSVASFAFTGLMLGLTSMWMMHERLRARFGRVAAWIVIAMSVGATGFGVAIGRFGRLNSWDVVTRPGPVINDVGNRFVHPFSYAQSTAATVAVAMLFGSAYLVLRAVIGMGAANAFRSAE